MSITFSNDVEADGMTMPADADGNPVDVIEFAAGLPGFPSVHRFQLEDLDEHLRPFRRMRAVSGPEISFTVIDPALLFPGYSVEIPDEEQASLDIRSADEVMLLVLVTVPRSPLPPTANLLGPIVINKTNGAAAQVVQHRSDHRVAEPLPGAAN